MNERDATRMTQFCGFVRGSLPFKYLGVPISVRRIKARDCELLVDKMITRVRVWSTGNLSFAGSAQLVNAVLMSIHSY